MKKFVAGMFLGIVVCFVLTASTLAFAGQQIKLYVNSEEIYCDVPPQVVNGRILVPARALAEALSCSVTWDNNTNAVYINQGEQSQGNKSIDATNKITNLRSLEIKAPYNQLALGGRIFNLQTEIQIHKLRIESDNDFKYQVSALMFPNSSQLTLYGRRFQTIASMLYLGTISDDDALQQLTILNNEWQQSIN